MKQFLIAVLASLPIIASAQGMNQQDMQAMMAQMQEVATCMQTVDQNELKGLEAEANQFEAKIKGLCQSGNRDEAQKKAIEFSQNMLKSPALVTMRKCTEKMPASMKGMMPNMDPEEIAKDYNKSHVCDQV